MTKVTANSDTALPTSTALRWASLTNVVVAAFLQASCGQLRRPVSGRADVSVLRTRCWSVATSQGGISIDNQARSDVTVS